MVGEIRVIGESIGESGDRVDMATEPRIIQLPKTGDLIRSDQIKSVTLRPPGSNPTEWVDLGSLASEGPSE